MSETMTSPQFTLVTPATWWRIPLTDPDVRRKSVQALVKNQFASVDEQIQLRRLALEEISATADAAAANLGLELYMSAEVFDGLPLGISLLVSWLPFPDAAHGLASLASTF